MEYEIKVIPIFSTSLQKKFSQKPKATTTNTTNSKSFSQILDLAIKKTNSGSQKVIS